MKPRLAPQLRHFTDRDVLRGLKDGTLYYDQANEAIVPSISGATQATADFELGVQGNSILTTDAGSGSAFNAVDGSGTGTRTYDGAHAYDTLAAKFTTPVGATSKFVQWSNATLGALTDAYGRLHFYTASNASTTTIALAQFRSSGTIRAQLRLDSTGHLQLWAASALITGGTSTNTISLSQFVRIEWRLKFSTTVGIYEVKLFNSPDSDTPTETITPTNQGSLNLGGASANESLFGIASNAASTTWWMDSLVWGAGSYPGPAHTVVPSLVVPRGQKTAHILRR